jgi:hypothetical protein
VSNISHGRSSAIDLSYARMLHDNRGKLAVVTGSARGVGSAFSENLASRGCRLVASDTDCTRLRG